MIQIDKVLERDDGEIIGVEISIDDKLYFISRRQDLWPGIRLGKFPPLAGGEVLYVGIVAFGTTEARKGEITRKEIEND